MQISPFSIKLFKLIALIFNSFSALYIFNHLNSLLSSKLSWINYYFIYLKIFQPSLGAVIVGLQAALNQVFIDSPVIPGWQWAKGAESTLTDHSSHDCKKISEHLLVLEWHACSYIDVCASKFPSRSRIYQEAVEFAEQKLSTLV